MWHALLLALAPSPLPVAVAIEDPKPAPVLVPGTRVRLAPPPGHEPGRGFLGYFWPEKSASLIVLEMPGAYAETAKGFDKAGLERGGMKLIERKETKVCGLDGLLVYASQDANGEPYRKWVALCGNDKRTVLLNAVFPAGNEAELSPVFRAVLLSAEWDPTLEVDPFAILPWTMTTPEGLRFGGSVGQTLIYTQSGELSREKGRGAEPVMIVSPSMGKVDVGDARAFAEKRVRQLPGFQKLEILRSEAFAAGGRTGWELTAKARHAQDQIDVSVYQVLLVGQDEYWLAVGTVGFEKGEEWVPRFRASAKSWQPKEAEKPAPKDDPVPK